MTDKPLTAEQQARCISRENYPTVDDVELAAWIDAPGDYLNKYDARLLMYDLQDSRAELAALRTRAEAAERRVEEMRKGMEPALLLIQQVQAAAWDGHYGKGLSKEYAQSIDAQVRDGERKIRALLAAPTAGRTDGERLDWLEKEQGDVYLTNNGERIVAGMPKRAGVYRGETIRAAIDAAMEPPAKGATLENGE